MSNFLVVLPSVQQANLGKPIFQNGIDHFRNVRNEEPTRVVESDWVSAASFARENGTGSPIVVDPQTGSWLLACGSWFHDNEYRAGQEHKLLERYLEVGAHRLGQELEGFFVIIIGDQERQELRIITDIIGSCHAFVRSWDGVVAFSHSSLMLACLDHVTLDPIGCQEYLNAGVAYESRTVYREVKKLSAGQVYWFVQGAEKSHEAYWQISDLNPDSLEGEVAVDLLAEKLVYAAQKVSHAYPHPVCDLTSGYDSRAVVAAFINSNSSFSTTVSGELNSPDVRISKSIAQVFGLSHLHITPQTPMTFHQVKEALRYTDGEYDMIEYARILQVHQRLMKSFDISINGSFGEVGRGYWWELLFPFAGKQAPLDARQIAQKRYVTQAFDESIFPSESRLDLSHHFAQMIQGTNAGLERLPNTLQMDHAYLRLRMQRWQGRIASSTNQLWPCLSPCMFRSVLEAMLETSTNLRRRGLLIRKMLGKVIPNLAVFPLEHGWPSLPVRWNTVHKFWPVPIYYGKKVVGKLLDRTPFDRGPFSAQASELPVRLRMWKEEEVQDLFASSSMRGGELLEPRALSQFLERSRTTGFAFDGQWSRLLSLECALATVRQASHSLPL